MNLETLRYDPEEGVLAEVFNGTNGTTFVASRTSSRANAVPISSTIFSDGTPDIHLLELPYEGVPWFVWAIDGATESGPECVIHGEQLSADATLIGKHLAQIIWNDRAAVEQRLKQWEPGEYKLAYSQFGFHGNIDRYPSVLVAKPSWVSHYVAMPLTMEISYSYLITCMYHPKNDEAELLSPVTDMAKSIYDMLNLPEYYQTTTESGIEIYESRATEGNTTMVQMDTGGFSAMASIHWHCQRLVSEPCRG